MRLGLFPKTNAADKRLFICAAFRSRRQFFDLPGVAPAEHDVLRLKRRAQFFDHVGHMLTPLPQSKALKPAEAEIVFKTFFLFVAQVSNLHWLDHTIND